MPASIDIPWSHSTVSVSIIDGFQVANVSSNVFYGPTIQGFETETFGGYSFLINHPSQNLVFDLGVPPDLRTDYPPRIVAQVEDQLEYAALENPKGVAQILAEGGVALDSINAIIWSHTHWDHIGRPSLFPPQTELVMGNGTLAAFGAGYPDDPNSPYLAREFHGRNVKEVGFPPDSLRIGGLAAIDYFGDGSFFLLDTPGHEIGHLNGLARVASKPPSFILMGGDSFHHGAQLRPSQHVPLPKQIDLEYPLPSFPDPLPRHLLRSIHPSRNLSSLPAWAQNLTSFTQSPFVTISEMEDGSSVTRDPQTARDVILKLQKFDADERILIVTAHDHSLRDIVSFFPNKANDWQALGWKKKGRWQFIDGFQRALQLAMGDA